jgi:hypothetical protein
VTRLLETTAVPTRIRILLAVLGGIVGGSVTASSNVLKPWHRDFGQAWFAGRAVLHGLDPYLLIGPGRAFDWPGTFFYPLPAALVATPLSPLPEPWACVAFSVLTGAALAWALSAYGYAPMFSFFSAPAHFAFENAQWSPLLTASVIAAPLGVFLVCKPTIGAAMFVARPSRWAVIGGIALLALAFVLQPDWVAAWRGALAMTTLGAGAGFPYIAPVRFPGGALALLCLLRWRRPEARLVAAMACVPQTLMLYEAVPLLLVPRTFREVLLFWVLGYGIANALGILLPPDLEVHQYLALSGPAMSLVLYPVATIMVLRRPNEGAVPAWLEARISGWPAWMPRRSRELLPRDDD